MKRNWVTLISGKKNIMLSEKAKNGMRQKHLPKPHIQHDKMASAMKWMCLRILMRQALTKRIRFRVMVYRVRVNDRASVFSQ